MTEIFLKSPKGFPVTVGGITLYLSGCKTVGTCVLKEQCTADNTAAVTAYYPKGTRLTMEGTLAPDTDAASVTAALAARLNDGTTEDITVQGLVYGQARLWGYTVHEGQSSTEVVLQFCTAQVPVRSEGEAV